jgi:23S rRNA pseudouridine1911/1915/1917 synthase
LKLQSVSGRRHQIRKHLSGIGHPILGDQQYGKDNISSQVKGLHLHSFSLAFTHPFTKKELHIEAPLPKRFRRFFYNL